MCIHLWDCVHSSSGWWQDHYICCIHFTGNWWLAGIIHWLLWVILYNSLYCIDLNHKSLHKPWLFRIYDWTRYAVAKCPLPHSKYFDMCERFDCQVWSMFTTEPVLRALHLPPPPPSKMSMLKTGNERISGYVLVHVGLSQPCHILIWATLYGKK